MAKATLTPPAFVDRLTQALTNELSGAVVRSEQVRGDRYRFEVVWPQFDGMGHPERQRLVWNIVAKTVDEQDKLNVGMILTLGLQDLPQE